MQRIIVYAIFYLVLMPFLIATEKASGDALYPKTLFSKSLSYAIQIHPIDFSREFDKLRNFLQEMLNIGSSSPFTTLKDLANNASPEMELKEEGDHYIVKFKLPDPEKWDINITVAKGNLILTGSSNVSSMDNHDNKIFRHEQKIRNFQRSLPLPGLVKENAIDTKYEKDHLTITLPKRPI